MTVAEKLAKLVGRIIRPKPVAADVTFQKHEQIRKRVRHKAELAIKSSDAFSEFMEELTKTSRPKERERKRAR